MPGKPLSASHVVFLVNFLSPNLFTVLQNVNDRVGKLTILVSVPIEANRQFEIDYGELTVRLQKTKTIQQSVNHPSGYEEELFVHIPLDTFGQLRRLRPDCIVSLEMGSRSVMSAVYRRWNRRCRHVLSVYGSERSEAGRGRVRTWLRRRLVRAADVVTFNGPSCDRYLQSLGAQPQRMLPWNYAADPRKPYVGPIIGCSPHAARFLTVAQLIERKGTLIAARVLSQWATRNPELHLEWTIVGTGPQEQELREMPYPPNLRVNFAGHCDPVQMRELYSQHECLIFPTLSDEWGLVVDEALGSGMVVLGSLHSQAVETLIKPGDNGWSFDPEVPETMLAALDLWEHTSSQQRQVMREAARHSVEQRSPLHSAEQFIGAVCQALTK